jgi:Ca2+-binding RTX toxin-like protein
MPGKHKNFSNDVIIGDDLRIDVLYGDTTGDISEGRGGNDQIFGLGGTAMRGAGDNLYGDAGNLLGDSRGGNDLIDGGAFGDLLHGDAANGMFDNARGGNDQLFGGTGTDTARGDALMLHDNTRGGNDLLDGGEGNDHLYGDATFLRGSSRGGNDRIDGGPGDDYLWGDAQFLMDEAEGGRDTFAFGGMFGADRVMDFRTGEDLLEFAVPGVDGFEDLIITPGAAETVITVVGYGSVALTGLTGSIAEADVVFV